jgi:hypothetical protein
LGELGFGQLHAGRCDGTVGLGKRRCRRGDDTNVAGVDDGVNVGSGSLRRGVRALLELELGAEIGNELLLLGSGGIGAVGDEVRTMALEATTGVFGHVRTTNRRGNGGVGLGVGLGVGGRGLGGLALRVGGRDLICIATCDEKAGSVRSDDDEQVLGGIRAECGVNDGRGLGLGLALG